MMGNSGIFFIYLFFFFVALCLNPAICYHASDITLSDQPILHEKGIKKNGFEKGNHNLKTRIISRCWQDFQNIHDPILSSIFS